jgi:short-subunit dehydrogenase
MAKSIGIFGAGPGLGQAVALRYAREGFEVVLVARRRQPLDVFARDLASTGARVHVITADLADIDSIPALAEQVRAAINALDTLYYAPTPDEGFFPATELTPRRAQAFMPLGVYSLLALIQQFLPDMLEARSGAILTAQGASAVRGLPHLSGPGPAQAAQRNYLQSLHAEVAEKGVFVGMLYIGAIIEKSAFHTQIQQTNHDGGGRDWGPTVDPAHLADVLWNMHSRRSPAETIYPERRT